VKYRVIREVRRENNFEVWAEISDDGDILLIGNYIVPTGAAHLSKQALDTLFENVVFSRFDVTPSLPARQYTADEVTIILREKGYLAEGEEFSEDMAPIG